MIVNEAKWFLYRGELGKHMSLSISGDSRWIEEDVSIWIYAKIASRFGQYTQCEYTNIRKFHHDLS